MYTPWAIDAAASKAFAKAAPLCKMLTEAYMEMSTAALLAGVTIQTFQICLL